MRDTPLFTPEMVPDEIKFIPCPASFYTRDLSHFEPNFDNDPELAEVYNTQDIRDQFLTLIDPVKWAMKEVKVLDPYTSQVVNFEPRWYQQQLLQDDSRYQTWRLGRQSGKCLPGFVRVRTSDGSYALVDEIVAGARPAIHTLQENFKFTDTTNYFVASNGIKEVFRVTTSMGRRIYLTDNHPLFTFRGARPEWIELQDVQVGDRVAVPATGVFGHGCSLSDTELKILGYLIGDGGMTTHEVRWTSANGIHVEDMKGLCEEYETTFSPVSKKDKTGYRFQPYKVNRIRALVEKVGLWGHGSHTKFVPREIVKGTKEQIATFLSRLFATDGWAYSKDEETIRGEIGYCSVSRNLIEDVQSLLLKFGILSSVSTKKVKYKGEIRIAYQLEISSTEDLLLFVRNIGIFGKESAVASLVVAIAKRNLTDNQKIRCIPSGVMQYVEERRVILSLTKRQVVGGETYDNQRMRNDAPCPRKLKQYAKGLGEDQYLYDLADSEIIWDPVVEIVSVGEHETYDLSDVDGTHNFVANEVVVHNSTNLMVKALHHAFTHSHSEVLILTPYDEQVRKLFHDVPGFKFMIENSETIAASVNGRITLSPPYRIKFNNGSQIVGATCGTKSGAGGGASRGKTADLIILDEADYLDDADLRTIMGVRLGRPNVRVIASSTPSGKRGLWYKWNFDGMWSNHHFTSAVLPYWGMIMGYDQHGNPITFGQEMVAGFDEYGVITEILAEFPEELTGVFQKYYLDIMFGDPSAMEETGLKDYGDYRYGERAPNKKTNKRIMGVDVDKYAAGPEIVIVEWDDLLQKMFVLYRHTMPRGNKGQLTLHSLVDKIIELDSMWKTSFVYVDRGYGEMVIEGLHKYGREHETTMLHKRVIPVFYGESIEIPDPARRGVISKQPIKPYIVNNAVRFTERMEIVASRYDLKLKRQMESYQIVSSSTVSGQPRYTCKNEHALDALMFALYGMTQQFSQELRRANAGAPRVIRSSGIVKPEMYIDPYTDKVLPKQEARNDPTVLQTHDMPAGMRKINSLSGRKVVADRVGVLGRSSSRTIYKGSGRR